jgi:hypothetical protein
MTTMPQVNLEDLKSSAATLTDSFTRVESLDKEEEPLVLEDAWDIYMEKKELHRRLLSLYRKTHGDPPAEYTLKHLGDHNSPSPFTARAVGSLCLMLVCGCVIMFHVSKRPVSDYPFSHLAAATPNQPIFAIGSSLKWELLTDLFIVLALISVLRRVATIIFRARKQDRRFTRVELQVLLVSLLSALFTVGVLAFSVLFTKEA